MAFFLDIKGERGRARLTCDQAGCEIDDGNAAFAVIAPDNLIFLACSEACRDQLLTAFGVASIGLDDYVRAIAARLGVDLDDDDEEEGILTPDPGDFAAVLGALETTLSRPGFPPGLTVRAGIEHGYLGAGHIGDAWIAVAQGATP